MLSHTSTQHQVTRGQGQGQEEESDRQAGRQAGGPTGRWSGTQADTDEGRRRRQKAIDADRLLDRTHASIPLIHGQSISSECLMQFRSVS